MGDIQNVSGGLAGKASRSLTPVSEKLGRLLKLVNIVPPDAELPDLSEVLAGVSPLMQEVRLIHELNQICKTLPDLVSIYVWLGEDTLISLLDGTAAPEDSQFEESRFLQDEESDYGWSEQEWRDHKPTSAFWAAINYTYLRESREMLRDIARHSKSNSYYISNLPKTRLSLSHGTINIDGSGRLSYSPPPFIKSIEGVEASRIRECEVCGRLFWAGRLDQKTCTTKCAKILRTRRWRENYQTKYKINRIENEVKSKKSKSGMKQRNTRKK